MVSAADTQSARAATPAVAIIGAGPAGLMAAEVLSALGHPVTLYERMPSPARKFLMAGRGGLNLTHSEPLATFITRYGPSTGPVQRAVTAFPPDALTAWANGLGSPTFVGSSGRVFPKAMKASPLLRAWLQRLAGRGVTLHLAHTWTGFGPDGALLFSTPAGDVKIAKPPATILALGGASWPRLGSDGRWMALLEAAGVAVAPLMPANCGIAIPWSAHIVPRLAGQPLKRIAISCGRETRRGEAVITAFGLEGGAVYALLPALRSALSAGQSATLMLDLKPDTSHDDLARKLALPRGSQTISNFLRKATRLDAAALAVLREAGPLPDTPAALAARLKSVPLTVTGIAPIARAISTAGGVRLDALDAHWMVKDRPGLFIAGEMLDWEAPTGGYLLQACFATAVAAANGVHEWLRGASPTDRALAGMTPSSHEPF